MTGGSLPPFVRCCIDLEDGNPRFRRSGDFLIDVVDHSILRYLGTATEVAIPDDIERIDEGCFALCEAWSATFGPLSKLSSIGCSAFRACTRLTAIVIPATVTALGDFCFGACDSLHSVSFCPGSTLDCVPTGAFRNNGIASDESTSIILPATVKMLKKGCFEGCSRVVNSPLPHDSEIVRIEERAFADCVELKAMVLPTTLEFVGRECFIACHSLSSLTFGSPSQLRELLHFPVSISGFVAIPDSVEILGLFEREQSPRKTVLTFGAESRLGEVRVEYARSLLDVTSRSLKVFRARLEFST
jgi:hypothetical protein